MRNLTLSIKKARKKFLNKVVKLLYKWEPSCYIEYEVLVRDIKILDDRIMFIGDVLSRKIDYKISKLFYLDNKRVINRFWEYSNILSVKTFDEYLIEKI